ncbi:cyclin-Q [Malaya genurostris]|uniref:cyclin-Q n=1 Tax=Malaya genurostris TaxID=325434 RepID=UPI0026F38317|nr:cyclin-Q [Malaya genurostris]XP_058466408.1 cyclin-Q [Malaya genurostris]XP_058466409.1 cyclin-Q [Malaya genurostris]XP_058466410.1 cyclin-Q [Malaya genurostris]XP_058466411.1 cyclin-Q [Malaya genurostris]
MIRDIPVVMSLSKDSPLPTMRAKQVDYKGKNAKGMPERFLFECAIKLSMKPLSSAMAAVLFHRFFREVDDSEYDPYMVASSCLYLAGKIKDDPVKIRDVINVTYNTINRDSQPLELGDEYWSMRDTIVQAELFITRILKFDLTTVHPHKYMLHYMKSIQNWFGVKEWNSLPVAKTAASFLQDFHHSSKVLDHKPDHIAVCCLALAFQAYGVQVPLTVEVDEETAWYNLFCKDLTREKHWEIIEDIMEVYNAEAEIDEEE